METFGWIRDWERDKADICKDILGNNSNLKIILKTKDEIYLLRRWLDHHLGIVGSGNVIVFDNGSSAPEINDIYLEYKDRIVIARFASYPDDIHIQDRFPELYSAILKSCRFFSFLDTDEYLIWMKDSNRWIKDPSVVDSIMARAEVSVSPASGLETCRSSRIDSTSAAATAKRRAIGGGA